MLFSILCDSVFNDYCVKLALLVNKVASNYFHYCSVEIIKASPPVYILSTKSCTQIPQQQQILSIFGKLMYLARHTQNLLVIEYLPHNNNGSTVC